MSTPGFTGGEKFKQHMDAIIGSMAGGDLEVGFMENSTCGRGNTAHAPSVAFWNEYGTTNKEGGVHIPARPFFRTAIARHSPRWGQLIAIIMKNTKFHYSKTLHQLGMVIVSQIQQQIEETTEPPNAEATVGTTGKARRKNKRGKGFNKPLEDSKNMKRAVNYRIAQ